MKKVIILTLIISMVAISILSGCVDSNVNNQNSAIESTNTVINTGNGNISKESPTGYVQSVSGTGNNKGSNWCEPGSKTTVKLPSGDNEFTVIGITTYYGIEVCQAEMVYKNGKATKYFSKDGKFEAMTSTASGSGNVSSEARSEARSGNISGK